jgi:hypothetical protein
MRYLAGAVLALGLALLATNRPQREEKPALAPLPADPQKVRLTRAGASVTLEKTGDAWTMTEPVRYPADAAAVARLLGSLGTMTAGDELTDRVESHALYEVTDASGCLVTVSGSSDTSAAWIFGKTAPDRAHVYVRPADSPRVYLTAGPPREEVALPVSRWRDRRVVPSADDDRPQRITYRRGKDAFELKRGSAAWTAGGRTLEDAAVDPLLSSLRTLSAEDFIDPPQSEEAGKWILSRSTVSLEVSWSSGRETRLKLGPLDATVGLRTLKRGDDPILLRVPDYSWEDLSETLKSLSTPH